MVFDTQTLTRLIERGLELAEDGGVPADVRAGLLAQGKRLREQLVHLLGARFDARSSEFKQAIESLHQTHHCVAEAVDDPDQAPRAVARMDELAGVLERALAVATRA